MAMTLNSMVEAIIAKGSMSDADVLALRRECYDDGNISRDEASRLFAINDAAKSHTPAWTLLFTEALSDFVVHQMQPTGYVDEINAEWLITHIDADGKLESCNELELLPCLNLYALNQVKRAVLSGEGVTRSGKTLKAGVVTETDVDILRRILYAYGSGDNIGITSDEAELLFDINDATAQANNHASWNVLFAQAIANHLMVAQGHIAKSREVALRQEQWLNDKSTKNGFLNTMVKGLRDIYNGSESVAPKRGAKAENITTSEANWLTARINKDGHITAAERAVLTFIKQESPDIDPVLRPLLDLVA
jgi:hypothetical protein